MSPVATLVERSTRYLMLVDLPGGHRAELVADALAAAITTLPRQLVGSFAARGVLELLAAAGTPALLRALGEDGLRQAMMTRSPRTALMLPAQILAAL